MHAINDSAPLNELLKIEKDLYSPELLKEAQKPHSSAAQILSRTYRNLSGLYTSTQIISTLSACERIALKIHFPPPAEFQATYALTFSDRVTRIFRHGQLLPLLHDSDVIRGLFKGNFSETQTREATFNELSSATFETILKSFYQIPQQPQLLTPLNLLDVLDAGYFLMNNEVIRVCLPTLAQWIQAGKWDFSVNLDKLVSLTFNRQAHLKTICQSLPSRTLEGFLPVYVESVMEKLKHSGPSLWNLYVSHFETALGEFTKMIEAVERIEGSFKFTLNKLIIRKIKAIHHHHNLKLLGTIPHTVHILRALLDSGFSKKAVLEMIIEFKGDLQTYCPGDKKLQSDWDLEAQKLLNEYQLELARS